LIDHERCQLLELAKLSKKSPYSMLAPILPKVAVLIATQYTTTPTLLFHCSSLISQAPSNFLETLLPHYLPDLVATCSRAQLDAIAKTLGQPVAALIIHNSADVLEKVFLLETTAQTEAPLSMINEYLSAAAPKRRRGEGEKESNALASMVKSCIVPLLGKLVFELGDLEMDRKSVVSSCVQHFQCRGLIREHRCSMLFEKWKGIVQRS
jgi:serine/threonine-protein kinase ATR